MRASSHESSQLGSKHVPFGVVGLVGGAWFVVAVVLLHFLADESYDPVEHTLSEFAVGRYGFLMTSAFAALAAAELAASVGLWRAVEGARFAPALLFLTGVADVLSAIFETDPPDAPETTQGALHNSVGIVAILFLVPMLLSFAWRFRRDIRWRSFSIPTMLWAVAVVVAFVVVLALGEDNFGISQRIFIGVYLSWLLAVATRLVRSS